MDSQIVIRVLADVKQQLRTFKAITRVWNHQPNDAPFQPQWQEPETKSLPESTGLSIPTVHGWIWSDCSHHSLWSCLGTCPQECFKPPLLNFWQCSVSIVKVVPRESSTFANTNPTVTNQTYFTDWVFVKNICRTFRNGLAGHFNFSYQDLSVQGCFDLTGFLPNQRRTIESS